MISALRPLVALLLGCLLASLLGASSGPPLSGDFARRFRLLDGPFPAPDYAFQDAKGEYRALVEFKGQVVLAMFWATWCGVCAREMPKLGRVQARFGKQGLVVAPLAQEPVLDSAARAASRPVGPAPRIAIECGVLGVIADQ